jgi:uncharacterized membrane protein
MLSTVKRASLLPDYWKTPIIHGILVSFLRPAPLRLSEIKTGLATDLTVLDLVRFGVHSGWALRTAGFRSLQVTLARTTPLPGCAAFSAMAGVVAKSAITSIERPCFIVQPFSACISQASPAQTQCNRKMWQKTGASIGLGKLPPWDKGLLAKGLGDWHRPPYHCAMIHRLFQTRFLRLFAVLAALWALPTPAHAQFAVCNQSFDVMNVAIGQYMDGAFQTEGWWTVGPNQCANVIKDELISRYIYLYAQDVFGQPILNGTTQLCIAPRKFVIRGEKDCWALGNIAAGFIEVDTQKTQRWTMFLSGTQ